jgi:hypothetical protein
MSAPSTSGRLGARRNCTTVRRAGAPERDDVVIRGAGGVHYLEEP